MTLRFTAASASLLALAACSATPTRNLVASGSPEACATPEVQDLLRRALHPDTRAVKARMTAASPIRPDAIDGIADGLGYTLTEIGATGGDKAARKVACKALLAVSSPHGGGSPTPTPIGYVAAANATDTVAVTPDRAAKAAVQSMFVEAVRGIDASLVPERQRSETFLDGAPSQRQEQLLPGSATGNPFGASL
ncbi:hypothetical protein [uncultured Sphingomonas sp.]|uniref:hypothetical protein n=1 Tax=uncultured Sphingomonas sp. TaxID=158754 RepID=UPI0025ED08DA|nr:hypothetical protein [uncultured Sphingomonas sp.]